MKLVVNPLGGIANRMRALTSAVSLAKDMDEALKDGNESIKGADGMPGKVELEVVWLKNWELYAAFEEIFAVPEMLEGKIVYPSAISYELLYSPPRRRNLYISAATLRRFGFRMVSESPFSATLLAQSESDKELLARMKDCVRKGKNAFIQGGVDLYTYSPALYRSLFKPVDDIAQRVGNTTAEMGEVRYGIHIRRTDNAESRRQSPDELFEKAIREILDKEGDARFYLATDDEDVKVKFRTIFGNRMVTSPAKASRNTVEGIRDAATEMFVLSRTKLILGSYYSSFSEAASIIGDVPLKVIKKEMP